MIRGRVRHVVKRYGRRSAIVDVTLDVKEGEVLGLVGSNGAGKTTLLRIMAMLLRPTSGSVEAVSRVRYFAGEHMMPPSVVARRWLAMWGVPASSADHRRPLGVLSRGMRQRIGLEAMLGDRAADLLLLDEPWEGLDPDASRWLSAELRQRRAAGAGIIVSSHRMHDLADVCDRCLFLDDGKLSGVSLSSAELAQAGNRSSLLFETFDRARQR
ncbi:MAG TPA: ATP-binding cassette domain-containing protein [Vicinamibacterales bacterium]|nr:ATP-binding cassette domain-containing protein [Vicinamibacterales bacterium]